LHFGLLRFAPLCATHLPFARRPGRTRAKARARFAGSLSSKAKLVPTGVPAMCGKALPRRHLPAASVNALTCRATLAGPPCTVVVAAGAPVVAGVTNA